MCQNCLPFDRNINCLASVISTLFCKRDSLILAVNGNFSHGKAKTYATVFMDLFWTLNRTVCLITGSETSAPSEDPPGPKVRVLMGENKAPCPADTRQTNIRWSFMYRLGPAGLNSCQSSAGQSQGSPRFTHKDVNKQAIIATLLLMLAYLNT